MENNLRHKYEYRAKVFKAMGHPTRLFILDELGKQERCVHELTEMVGADVSTVSKHLSLLKESGLVEYDKRGTQIFYSLAAPCVLNFFDCLEALLHNQMHKQLAWMNG
jgi:ArsR family transcriptional regulator